MSKEEILENQKHGFDSGQWESALKAMDEHAKSEAMAFAEWATDNYQRRYSDTFLWDEIRDDFAIPKSFTLPELYDLYLKSKV